MAPHIEPGTLLAGRYRVTALAGTGGMSTVYRALDEQLGRTVAVKVFTAHVAAGPDARRRASEVRLLASLDHPALVTLLDVVESDRGTLVVMQFVDGTDLGELIEHAPLSGERAIAIGTSVASALASVHARGIIHRDIKPGNILIPSDEVLGAPVALLADFGIARLIDDTTLTAVGSVVGTAQYLSPEQARGSELTTASDIYSLGLVILESLTGTRTFPGSGVEAVVVRLSRDPHLPTTMADGWRDLLSAMTAREPADRPGAEQVATRLAALDGVPALTEEPDATAPLSAGYAPTRRLDAIGGTTEALAAPVVARRDRRPLVVGAVIGALLVIAAIVASVAVASSGSPEVATTPTPSVTVPTPSETAVIVPDPEPTATPVAPVDNKPGKDKPCKGNGKKKDC